jgi:regulator of sigma E protease
MIEKGQEANYRNIQIQIAGIAKNSPAEKAGIKIGDAIQKLTFNPPTGEAGNEQLTIKEIEDVQKFVAIHVGEEITIETKRGKEIFQKNIIPRVSPPKDEGALGILMAKTGIISYPWYQAIVKGFETTGKLLVTMVGLFYLLIKTLILKGTMIGEVAGPVGIFGLISQMVQLGWIYVLQFAAILSINLAIINVIPIPALDGGRLLFLAIEKIKGKPIRPRTEQLANSVGFAIIILLMLVITFRDVIKLF